MKVRLSILALVICAVSVSCKKNDVAPQKRVDYTLPSSYNFSSVDSNAARTILSMVSEIEAYTTAGNTSGTVLNAATLKSMLANTGGFFRDTIVNGVTLKLNASGVNLKSLITPS